MSQQIKATLNLPSKLSFLSKPSRYKVAWGGRGGGKSWGFADMLLFLGAQERPIRVLCAREFQSSIRESVHQLLSSRIDVLGYSSFYNTTDNAIRGLNGTQFFFEGIKRNVQKIKSYEGIDITWVEEAQSVSKTSWDILIPTIRKEGSEIWVTFNPELETDETYKRFVLEPPANAIVTKINWSDNPWFPQVLEIERLALKAKDEDAYLNVWEGHCRQHLEGAVYAKELRESTANQRITSVPYDTTKPVHTFWDLGWSDHTSIWFAQAVGFEYRIIDFVQDRQKTIGHFLRLFQDRPYIYGFDWLPHDAENSQQAANGRSIADLMRAEGRKVRIVPKSSLESGINAARTVFPNCWFDNDKCADGLQALRHYRYDVDPDTGQFSKIPLHDEYSHAADAFRYLALSLKEQTQKPLSTPKPKIYTSPGNNTAWMGR